MTAAMILAAGLGTRLRPLTDELPKPLVPIGDRAAIFHVLARVRAAAVSPIVVNAHASAELLAERLAGESDVIVSHEPALLGTAGGVAHAASLFARDEDVLVWNADVLAELDARALLDAHAHTHTHEDRADATLAVRPLADGAARGRGNVGLDDEGRVVRLRGKTFRQGETRGADFLGVHVIGGALRRELPRAGCLVGDLYIPRGRDGATLRAFVTNAPFVDVGTLRAYFEAHFAWLRARGERAWIAGSASIDASVRLGEDVIVGEGARVVGDGLLERVVVWPKAIARAPLSDAVVTPRGATGL